ncbi:MAG: hypothetical protein QOF49_1183, partial [Chloroflexota bacterium]|nr:hypothetical protein [Chloroflexota bacterium]
MSRSETALQPPAGDEAAAAGLPAAVAAALDSPGEAHLGVVESAGVPFATRTWGAADAPPILLIHGVTASSRIWWRIGPALATGLGARIVAVDQAGHGRTGHWTGHHRFADNAADLVAFIVSAGLARPDLGVVGHSWGGMTAAALPAAGLRPRVLVLLDPPAVPASTLASMLHDPVERRYDAGDEAVHALGDIHPTWPWGDVVAKAEALTQLDEAVVRAILTENGDWDGGLAALSQPAAADVPVWLIRGDPAAGGLVPDAAAIRLAERIGSGHVITIAGGAHAPMRAHPAATTLALLRALAPDGPGSRPADAGLGAGEDAAAAGGPATAPSLARRVASAIGDAADHVETAASAVGSVVEAAARRLDERPGARVRRVRRLGRTPLRYLYDVHPDARSRTPRELGIQTIDVADIAGTAVGGGQQRGGDFLPLKAFRTANWAARWQRLGRAIDTLAVLPPIDVLRYDDTYWVVDGHNRVA